MHRQRCRWLCGLLLVTLAWIEWLRWEQAWPVDALAAAAHCLCAAAVVQQAAVRALCLLCCEHPEAVRYGAAVGREQAALQIWQFEAQMAACCLLHAPWHDEPELVLQQHEVQGLHLAESWTAVGTVLRCVLAHP